MDFDFNLGKWLGILANYPVISVLFCGLLIGTGFTQIIKKTWLAFGTATISTKRYNASLAWLSAASTFLGTHTMWMAMIPIDAPGLGRIVSLVAAFGSPKVFDWTR